MQLRRVVALLALGGCEALVVSPSLIERSAWRHRPTTRRTSTPFLAQTPESLSPPGSAAALDDEQTRELASAVDAAAALEEPTTSPSTTSVSATSGPDQLLPKEPEADTGVWRLVVLGLTVLWASNFAVIKLIFQECPDLHASEYAALRFAIAAVALLPALAKGLKSAATRAATRGGLEIGGWISLGYFGQAIGLLTTTANKSAFICSLHVIWVAAITSVIKSDVEKKAIAAALLAVGGVGCLELSGSTAPVIGDLWSLAQPIGFGTGYIRLEQLMKEYPEEAAAISAAKVLVVGLFAMTWATVEGGGAPHLPIDLIAHSPLLIGCFLWMGLVTTAASIAVESYAFRFVPAQDAAIILSSEPLWAAALAYAALGEQFGANDAFGGALVISACVLNEIPQKRLPQFLRNEAASNEGGEAVGGDSK